MKTIINFFKFMYEVSVEASALQVAMLKKYPLARE